jgi:hypothetical protein
MVNRVEAPQKKEKIGLPYDSATPLLGTCLKEYQSGISVDTGIPMYISALFTITKLWKQPSCPKTEEWIKKI